MMKTGVSVGEAMTTRPIYVTPKTTLAECATVMKQNNVGALLVKHQGNLVGILTEEDIVRRAVAKFKHPGDVIAEAIMAQHLITADPGTDLFEAINLMKDHEIRHLPVIDGKKLLGLATLKDILKISPHLFETLVDKMELREEERKPINNYSEEEGLCENCGEYDSELVENDDGQLVCNKCL